MKIGKILLAAGLGLICTVAPSFAEGEEAAEETTKESWLPGSLSGNVGVVTDYSFRGISQTNKNMALQGGIDWEHDSGVFVGMWASSLDYSSGGTTTGGYLEQDFYGGYSGNFSDAFSYDVTAIFFFYPGDEQYNYWEFVLGLGYDFDFMSVKAGFLGSPDYFGIYDTGIYASTGFAVPIPLNIPYFDLTFDANAGYTHADRVIFEDHHYFDWNAGLVVALPFNLSLDFRYVGTDVKHVANTDNRFVFGATYSF